MRWWVSKVSERSCGTTTTEEKKMFKLEARQNVYIWDFLGYVEKGTTDNILDYSFFFLRMLLSQAQTAKNFEERPRIIFILLWLLSYSFESTCGKLCSSPQTFFCSLFNHLFQLLSNLRLASINFVFYV